MSDHCKICSRKFTFYNPDCGGDCRLCMAQHGDLHWFLSVREEKELFVREATYDEQFDTIRRNMRWRYVGDRYELKPWDDHQFNVATMGVTQITKRLHGMIPTRAMYEYTRPWRVRQGGRHVYLKLDRKTCDEMAAVAYQQLLDIGLLPGKLVNITPELTQKIKALPNWSALKGN